MKKFKIKAHSSQLVSFFPPLVLEEECEYCKKPLLKNRPSRTGYSRLQPYCPVCHHVVGQSYCPCRNCQKEYVDQKLHQAEKEKIQTEEKRLAIKKAYDPSLFQKVEEQNLTLFQRLSLAVLLRLGLNEEGKVIHPPIGYLNMLTPQPDLSGELLLALINNNIIIPDIHSSIDAFEDGDQFPTNFLIYCVSYYLNLAPEDGDTAAMFKRLMMPDPTLFNEMLMTFYNVLKLTLLIVLNLTDLLSNIKGKQIFASPIILQINHIGFIFLEVKPNIISTGKNVPVSAQFQTAGKSLSIS